MTNVWEFLPYRGKNTSSAVMLNWFQHPPRRRGPIQVEEWMLK